MNHILIVITSFRHGGTNKSLENLLSLIDTEKYQVDVFALEHYGPYKEMLPNCTILPSSKWLNALIAHFGDTKGLGKVRSLLIKLLRIIGSKLKISVADRLYKNISNRLLKNKKYNAVIAYSEGAPTAFVSWITHPNKIAWVHCDYSSYMELNNHPDERNIYTSYKSIVCVSEYTKGEFCRILPECEIKTFALHNLLNDNKIKLLAEEEITDKRFENKGFTIVSVGRIDKVKRFDLIPKIASELKEKGCQFKWYLIGTKGFDSSQSIFDANMSKYKVEDVFIWLGEKENPYPYFSNSDLLVITSKSEACPYVLNEAKVLNVPSIITNFSSASEFIDNDMNGVIVPVEKIGTKIEEIITNQDYYNRIKRNLLNCIYDNKAILVNFYKIVSV